MKILHVCNQFWPGTGGVEKIVMDLCRETGKEGFENAVLCLNRLHGSTKTLPASDQWENVPITRVPFLDAFFYKPAILPLRELKNADLILVHGISALLDFVALCKVFHHKPIVVLTHGGIFHTLRGGILKKIYFFGVERLVLKLVDRVVACSKPDFALFRPITKRIVLIENGVALERFKALASQEKDRNVFLFAGRLSRNKQVDWLIRTFGRLQGKMEFELRIVGEDWEGLSASLKKIAKEEKIADRVVFTGKVSEDALLSEYAKAGFFVSASRHEGFGITVIEAMASGCIPLLNPIPSFSEFVRDGENGFLVDFSNAEKAAERILALNSCQTEEIAKRAVARAEHFSWKSRLVQWKQLFMEAGKT